jgi:hypothetical protein
MTATPFDSTTGTTAQITQFRNEMTSHADDQGSVHIGGYACAPDE